MPRRTRRQHHVAVRAASTQRRDGHGVPARVPRRVRRAAPAVLPRRLQPRAHPRVRARVSGAQRGVHVGAGLRVAVRHDRAHDDRVVDGSRHRHSLPDHLLEDRQRSRVAGRPDTHACRHRRHLRRPLQSAAVLRTPADRRVVVTGTDVIVEHNISGSASGKAIESRGQSGISDCVFEHPVLPRHVYRSSTSTGLSQLQVSERRAHHPTAEALVDELSAAGV